MPEKKKKEREFVGEPYVKTTKAGTRLTSGIIGETEQRGKGTYTKQKRFKGAESPDVVRLRELAKGEERLLPGTPEYEQYKKEFPTPVRQFDPEERAFFDPSLTPAQLEREGMQFKQKKIQEAQTQQQLEQAGAFEQVTPAEPSLQPTEPFGSGVPVLGPAIAAISEAIAQSFPSIKGKKASTGETAFPGLQTEQSIREEALRIISQKNYDEGISKAEAFGSFVEGIPIVGSLASKYARGLIETPSSNAENVIAEINKIKEAASTGQEKVRNGLESPSYGLDRARSMEEDLAKLQGRLKMLINTSPILRANTDEINKIQEEVLEAMEKVNRYKTAAAYGLTAELTGTGRIIPTDEQIYYELKDIVK